MSSISGGFAELDAMIAALEPESLKRDLHETVAQEVARAAETQWGAGQGPEGQTWPANVSRGRGSPPLRRPTSEIAFRATEEGIAASADDVLRYHHPRTALYAKWDRQVFPDKGLSAPWADAADIAAEKVFLARFGKR